jgi:hypothetical protein
MSTNSIRKFLVTLAHRTGRVESYTRYGYSIVDVETSEAHAASTALSLTIEMVQS